MIDPCENIAALNFNSEEDLKKILFRDKHTRVEGLFTEHFFFQEIVNGKFENTSSSWWFSFKNGAYNISKIVISLKELTAFEISILNFFVEKNQNVFLIEFNEADKKFFFIPYKKEYTGNIEEYFSELKKEYPRNTKKAGIPNESERNSFRLNQAAEFLKIAGVFKKCAIERMFANCWLAEGFFWDIDFIVEYKNKLVAFEVKQKFPTAAGTWGLNVGLANLFAFLDTLGMEVIHVILVKPVKDDRIPAIDLYTQEKYRKNAKWIATRFTENFLNNSKSVAPAYTSIFGTSRLSYYNMKQEIFTVVKEVSSDKNEIIPYLEINIS